LRALNERTVLEVVGDAEPPDVLLGEGGDELTGGDSRLLLARS
jgi:hypothetical protein